MYDARLRENVPRVQERIARALQKSGRSGGVTLVAVTKGHPVDAVRAAQQAGLTDCGENRVPELEAKVESVGRNAVQWHLIGHLQRNKAKRALPLFDLIHSIDSLRLAQELSTQAEQAGRRMRGLVQVNVTGEETKGGIEAVESIEAALPFVREMAELPGVDLRGIMTMAPYTQDERTLRRTFERARALFERCGAEIAGFTAEHLSMGMSNDYELAVAEGSTMVRLGTTLFGERQK